MAAVAVVVATRPSSRQSCSIPEKRRSASPPPILCCRACRRAFLWEAGRKDTGARPGVWAGTGTGGGVGIHSFQKTVLR